jgi:hypothetical protein
MNARSIRIGALLALSVFGLSRVAIADDEVPKTTTASDATPSTTTTPSTSPSKATGSQTYITVGNVVGEILKVDSTSVTLRVQKPKEPPPGPQHAANKKQYEHELHVMHELAKKEAKNYKKNPHYIDYTMDFAVDAQARIQHLPAKLDENGKKVPYTAQEYKDLKGNPDIPGWKAELSTLRVKDTVEAHVVVLPAKANDGFKKDDMIVRWALILHEPTTSSDSPTKKKNK